MSVKNLKGTKLLERTIQSKQRFIIHVGGARAGKTIAIAQYLILECLKRKIVVTAIRKTLPSIKATAFRDFKWVMEELELWTEENMNLTEMTYTFSNGSLFEFISVDDPQKIRGRKRHIAWLNEGNQLTLEDFNQINLRTEEKVLIDYNPSDSQSWIYDIEDNRTDECDIIHSTYLDNPFLADAIKGEISKLAETDPESFKVFGLGQRGSKIGLVYPHYEVVDEFPQDTEEVLYGIDWGYNDPSVLVRAGFKGDILYVEELLYKSGMTTNEIAEFVSVQVGRSRVFADSAEPDRIDELQRKGIRVTKARKDIAAGIQTVKSYKIKVVQGSENLINELNGYRWKVDANNKSLDIPIGRDHILDALRYAVYNRSSGTGSFKFAVGRI
jgi:phage terminase large subunit